MGVGRGLLLAALLIGGPAAAERIVLGAPAALRAGPDPLYRAEAVLAPGTVVETAERSGGWVEVRLTGGQMGWVTARALTAPAPVRPVALKPKIAPPYATVVWPSSGALNLRRGPGTGYAVVRPMQRGDWVEVQEYAGNWVRLRHPSGDEGWAYRAYLTR
ncbi:MAG: SH3 domain-containing protein [Rhodobacter sp.]|nr:SH3 domain-containing protein [Rhodobacter sp.]